MSEEVDNHHQSARPNLLALFGAALAVLVSSVIAFCCTCFPVGLAILEYGGGLIIHDTEAQRRTNELLPIAYLAGGVAALLVAFFIIRYFRRLWSK